MKTVKHIRNYQLLAAITGAFIISVNTISAQITVTKSDVTCHGCTDGSASVSVTGGTPPYEYIWPGGSSSSSVTGLSPGYYVVVIVDANGCSGSASITINDQPLPPDPFEISIVTSADPNDITGPAGYGDPKWVSVKDELPYLIRFENDPKLASAAVNKVVITHPIDNMANMFSFKLGDFTFRNFSFQVPENTSHYFKRLNMVDSMGVYLDVTAGIDVTKKQAFWIFQAFDPVTGLPNINPELGFLLINDSITHNGEGSVRFSIKPKNSAATGDTIKAFASIIFDVNAPLLTNVAYNTIDAKPPASKVKSITTISSDVIEVSWNGSDDPRGSGVADYKLLISSNNEPYASYEAITDTSYIVNLNGGNEYKIQSIAKDHTNNTEQLNQIPDTIFYIRPEVKLGKNLSICINDSIILNAGSGFTSYKWNDESTNQTLTVKSAGKYFVTAVRDTIVSTDTIIIGLNQLPVPALHNNISEFCEGGLLLLNAGTGYKNYKWSTEEIMPSIEVNKPGKYSVTVTDINGCQGRDSIVVETFGKPVFSLGNDTLITVNDSIILIPDLKGITSYIWNDLSNNDSLLVIGKKAGIGSHDYWVKVTDNNTCTYSDTINVTVTFTDNIDSENQGKTAIYLYPNPTFGILNLKIEGIESGVLKLELFNMQGALLMTKQYRDRSTTVTDQFNLSNMAPGSYVLKITVNETEITRSIIKL